MAIENVLPEELMNSVLGKLYDLLTNGDDTVPKSDDNYLAWLSIGTPYAQENLDFLINGFTGVVKKQEGDSQELTQERMNQLMASDAGRKYMQAEQLARLCDMVPDTSGIKGTVAMNVWNVENSLSQAYYHTLKFSQVANFEPDADTKSKIERLRGLLQQTVTKKDLITEEETEVTEESELVKKYNEKLENYINVALEYNTHKVNALAGNNPAAVQYWAINASLLRNKVKAALNDWVTNGYKDEYEQIAAYISQVEGRSMLMLKQEYLDDMEKAKITGLSSGSDFYYTSLIPGSFARNDEGWTEFSFSNNTEDNSYSFKSRKTEGSVGLKIGRFTLGADGKRAYESTKETIDKSEFSLTFKVAQVPISRPWFNVNFLISNYWRFDQNNPEFKERMISDGLTPSNGMIPAYTTTAIFVKDLHLKFGESNKEIFNELKEWSAGGKVSFGPFSLGGSHESKDETNNLELDESGQGIVVKGMQLVGFKCHILPLSPNPRPDIEEWV